MKQIKDKMLSLKEAIDKPIDDMKVKNLLFNQLYLNLY